MTQNSKSAYSFSWTCDGIFSLNSWSQVIYKYVHSDGLARAITTVILGIIYLGWVELPLARTNFYGPKPVRAIEVILYIGTYSIFQNE